MDHKYSNESIKDIDIIRFSDVLLEIKNDSFLLSLYTGYGKTYLIAAYLLRKLNEGKKGLFLAPTNMLVNQQYEVFKNVTTYFVARIFSKDKKFPKLEEADIFFTTGALVNARLPFENINKYDFIIFDEIHNTSEDNAYGQILKNFKNSVIGLSATISIEKERLIKRLSKESIQIITKSTKKRGISYQFIPNVLYSYQIALSKKISIELKDVLINFPQFIQLFENNNLTAKEVILIPNYVIKMKALRLLLAYNYLNSQPSEVYNKFILKHLPKRADLIDSSKNFLKVKKIIEILKEKQCKKKTIIFSEYINTINLISKELLKNNIRHNILVGKANKNTNQLKAMALFKKEGGILLSTKVGEEGLDIDDAFRLIFFEPITNKRRIIQRVGRIGRKREEGQILVLGNKNTFEEGRCIRLLNFFKEILVSND